MRYSADMDKHSTLDGGVTQDDNGATLGDSGVKTPDSGMMPCDNGAKPNASGGLDKYIAQLPQLGFTSLTPVQKAVIPHIEAGESILFQSETGTGKTFAYLLPLIERAQSMAEGLPIIMVVCPTLELASQIKSMANSVSQMKVALLFGSSSLKRQEQSLKQKPKIVIGSAARLCELAMMKKLKTSRLAAVVFDEADRLVKKEAIDDTRALLGILPAGVQLVSLSATMTKKAREFFCEAQCLKVSYGADTKGYGTHPYSYGARQISETFPQGGGGTPHEKGEHSQGGECRHQPMQVIIMPREDVLTSRVEHWAVFSTRRDMADTLRSLIHALQSSGDGGRRLAPLGGNGQVTGDSGQITGDSGQEIGDSRHGIGGGAQDSRAQDSCARGGNALIGTVQGSCAPCGNGRGGSVQGSGGRGNSGRGGIVQGSGGRGGNSGAKILVFAQRGYDVLKITSFLQGHSVRCEGLYAKGGKQERKASLDRFRSGKANVLVTSDLSSRGLDITCITHVVQLGVDEDSDIYIHRAGRTARAGKSGVNIVIGDEIDLRRLDAIARRLGIAIQQKALRGGKLVVSGQ